MLVKALTVCVLMFWASPDAAGAQQDYWPDWTHSGDWGVEGLGSAAVASSTRQVSDFAELGDRVFVAGQFTEVVNHADGRRLSQPYLSAFEASTGEHIATFAPTLNGPVWALEAHGGRLYVGGEFTEVNGSPRIGLVALDPNTGATVGDFDGSVSRTVGLPVVMDLEVSREKLHVGGNFDRSHDSARGIWVQRLTRFDLATGLIDASWRPTVQGGRVNTVDFSADENRVYVGGYFTSVDASPDSSYFEALSAVDGSVLAGLGNFDQGQIWHPETPAVFDIHETNGRVFVASRNNILSIYRASDLHLSTVWGADCMIPFLAGDPRKCDTFVASDQQVIGMYGELLLTGSHTMVGSDFRAYPASRGGIAHWETGEGHPINFVTGFNPNTEQVDVRFMTPISAKGIWAIRETSDRCLWIGGRAIDGTRSPDGSWSKARGFGRYCPDDDLARGKPARQSSTWSTPNPAFAASAYRAVDGESNGGFWRGSTALTGQNTFVWWEVDLGLVQPVGEVHLRGRTDWCPRGAALADCQPGLAVFVSSSPIVATTLAALRAQAGVTEIPLGGPLSAGAIVPVGRDARYVRIATTHGLASYLALAEVRVSPGAGAPVVCGAAAGTDAAQLDWTPAAGGDTDHYIIRRSRNGGTFYWAGRVGAPGTAFLNQNVRPGDYRYTVETVRIDGSRSAPITCTPSPVTVQAATNGIPPVACATARAGSSADVSWTRAGNDAADSFIVERRRNAGSWFWAGRVDVPATTFTNASLHAQSVYDYRVLTKNDQGKTTATVCGLQQPVSVRSVTSCAASPANGNASVNWLRAPNDNATRFVVTRSRNGGPWWWDQSIDIPATSSTHDGLSAGQTYRYGVQTVGADGSVSTSTVCSGSVTG